MGNQSSKGYIPDYILLHYITWNYNVISCDVWNHDYFTAIISKDSWVGRYVMLNTFMHLAQSHSQSSLLRESKVIQSNKKIFFIWIDNLN